MTSDAPASKTSRQLRNSLISAARRIGRSAVSGAARSPDIETADMRIGDIEHHQIRLEAGYLGQALGAVIGELDVPEPVDGQVPADKLAIDRQILDHQQWRT
jgi:hypothetical protein